MNEELELIAAPGFVEPGLAAEFPGLSLAWVTVSNRRRSPSRGVRQRLRMLSNRFGGANVVAMRTQPIPHAYRAFFRQIGLDPDATRIPIEAAAVARLLHGGFRSNDLLADALLIALLETGVPVWALNADMVEVGGLGVRTSVEGEGFGTVSAPLAAGRLVVADARRIHALLFGPLAPGNAAEPRTPRISLFSVGVAGVPAIHIEEALWICGEALTTA
jgi:DNA/RNA-binding domain of Phe-tRNA-synthetase-like protein